MNDFWSSESMAIEDDQGRDALIAARTASVDQWSFLAGASSREDFANRLDLASASLDAAVASVTQSSPDSFLTTRAALADEFAKDFEAIHASRIKDEAEDNLAREAQLRVEAKAKSLADDRRKKTAADFGAPNPPSPQMTEDWGDYASADINVEIDRAQKAYDSAMNAAGRDVSEETIFGYTPEDMKQHVTRRQSSKAASLEDLSADQVLNMARKVLDTESSQNMKGFTLDFVSAKILNTVFEKASPKHQKRLLALSGPQFVDICFKMAAKGSRKTALQGSWDQSEDSDPSDGSYGIQTWRGNINDSTAVQMRVIRQWLDDGSDDDAYHWEVENMEFGGGGSLASGSEDSLQAAQSAAEGAASAAEGGHQQSMFGSRKTAENSADVVGYQYKADLYTPQALIELLIQEGVAAPAAAQMDAEDALTQIAEANAIDRFDESSYDSGEFPKVVFSGQSSEDNFVGYEGSKVESSGSGNYEDFDDAAESDAEAKTMVEASLKPSF